MKALFIVLLTGIVASAQPFTFNDIPFLGQTTTAAAAFSPSDVAGLVMWYKADAITGKSVGDGVTNWVDSSVLGITLTNTAASKQPAYTNDATIGGKPFLYFDGTDDSLSQAATLTHDQPITIFVMARKIVSTGNRGLFSRNGGSTTFLSRHEDASIAFGAGASLVKSLGYPSMTNRFLLYEFTANGASSEILTNGVSVITGDAGANSMRGFIVGAVNGPANYFLGCIAEVLTYTNNVSSGDRTSIRGYFTTKYGAYTTW